MKSMSDRLKEGIDSFKEGNFEESIGAFLEVVSEDNHNHKAWNALGVAYSKFGLCSKADICFRNALAYDIDNTIYQKNRNKNINALLLKGQSLVQKKKPLDKHIDDIVAALGVGILEAKAEAGEAIIAAARKSEIDLYRESGIVLKRWISVIDEKTCGVCLGLNGNIYEEALDERGLINYDTGAFLVDEIANLVSKFNIGKTINPNECKNGPPVLKGCRCRLEKIHSFEEYMNTPVIAGIITPLPDYGQSEKIEKQNNEDKKG